MASRRRDPPIHGILNINKPRGLTSFAVVTRVRRLTGMRRVGHAGTLDPIAEGVLPVCIGQATRIVDYLVDQPKAYRAQLRLGVATDTYDAEGAVTAERDASGVTRSKVEEALLAFTGQIEQLPPMYSAVKHEGQPLYRHARAGRLVERRPRQVTIYRLELLDFQAPLVTIEMECSKGTYVRTLAHDVGERLGCGAHMSALTRLRSGPFALEEAVTLEELERAADDGCWQELLIAPDRVLERWTAAILAGEHAGDVRHGRTVELTPVRPRKLEPGEGCRAYSVEGDFLGILRHQGGAFWHPERVFVR